jgi:hypothetical protein
VFISTFIRRAPMVENAVTREFRTINWSFRVVASPKFTGYLSLCHAPPIRGLQGCTITLLRGGESFVMN